MGVQFHAHFIPYMPSAEITNAMISQMAKEYNSLQIKCKAFDDALADLEDRYAEDIYPPPEWTEDDLSDRDRDLVSRIKGLTVRQACKKLRDTAEELCKANGVLKG
jgi:hypothetical protein